MSSSVTAQLPDMSQANHVAIIGVQQRGSTVMPFFAAFQLEAIPDGRLALSSPERLWQSHDIQVSYYRAGRDESLSAQVNILP